MRFLSITMLIVMIFGCSKKQNIQINTDAPQKIPENRYVTTESGLRYSDLKIGSKKEARSGNTVSVHYAGWLTDGQLFDTSFKRNQTFSFQLGAGMVIPGWDEGVAGMKIGGIRQLVIPPALGYGPRGAAGVIPPNATLIFEVELIDVK